MILFAIGLTLVLTLWGVVLFVYRGTLMRLWREPALRCPVLIIESDDWGPAPDQHAQALSAICEILGRCRDRTGRAAVMTVGVVLAVPDSAAIRAGGHRDYQRRSLLDPAFRAVFEALDRGRRRGLLALQLHGLEHLWPLALIRAATADGVVRDWIAASDAGTDTEALPSPLQSRWTDASVLPSHPLAREAIGAAVAEEVSLFRACFGEVPQVVVPPTFVWNEEVERCWAEGGVRVVITPGQRFAGRDGAGQPAFADRQMLNGEFNPHGQRYLVRDLYFEPGLGHVAEAALAGIERRVRLGRPALIETHRFNFTGDAETVTKNLAELERLLTLALERCPTLRFMSSLELADAIGRRDPDLVHSSPSARLHFWLRRLAAQSRLRKLAWITGLVLPASLLYFFVGAQADRPSSTRDGVTQ